MDSCQDISFCKNKTDFNAFVKIKIKLLTIFRLSCYCIGIKTQFFNPDSDHFY